MGKPLHPRIDEELPNVLIYLVGSADQCGVDLRSAMLTKVGAASAKYPVDDHKGCRAGSGETHGCPNGSPP